jgi:hypothetical protein
MVDAIKASRQVLRDYGLGGLIRRVAQFAYRKSIRRLLPTTEPVRMAGLIGPYDLRLGDVALTWLFPQHGHLPRYEQGLATGLRQHVEPGHSVVVVGGGSGITAALAAQLAGETGRVTCFEGNRQQADIVRETARRNNVTVDVHEAVVGVAIAVYGEASAILAPTGLPACDVLQLDCEGAEILILREMTIRPATVLVETHGIHGASSADVRALLEALGYAVEDLGPAEPDDAAFCAHSDIVVLAGTRPAE